jgi:hypothetical protein
MAGGAQPWWIADGCPTWCVEDHALQWHPGDHVHQGDIKLLPTVQLRRVWSDETPPTMTKELVAETASVARYRYRGEMDEWVGITGAGGQLDLSIESARRLLEALRAAVDGQ